MPRKHRLTMSQFPAPPCFSVPQWEAYLEMAVSEPPEGVDIHRFCVDCTPDYAERMRKKGLCIRPDVQFRQDEYGEWEGYVERKGAGALLPLVPEVAAGGSGADSDAIGQKEAEVRRLPAERAPARTDAERLKEAIALLEYAIGMLQYRLPDSNLSMTLQSRIKELLR